MKIIAQNKKAFFEYEILERLEAGVILSGDEVKSIRQGQVSLIGSYAVIHDEEIYLLNCRISPYKKAFGPEKDEVYATRRRKLLLHKKQLQQLIGKIARQGITVVPLKLYFNDKNIAKIELAVAKHKKAASRKKELQERDIARETRRSLRGK